MSALVRVSRRDLRRLDAWAKEAGIPREQMLARLFGAWRASRVGRVFAGVAMAEAAKRGDAQP